MYKNLLVVGASRGLGRAVARFASVHLQNLELVTLVSRKQAALDETRLLMNQGDPLLGTRAFGRVSTAACDLTTEVGLNLCLNLLKERSYDLVIYSAGGGPHGLFFDKDWKDHLWSLNLNLLAPMKLVHHWLNERRASKSNDVGRFIIVGSRIAENQADPLAASYAAGKHGLHGFVSSLQLELESSRNKVGLFSPGYMDTLMLPATAKVRHDGSKLMSSETAAQALLRWAKSDGPWHRVLN